MGSSTSGGGQQSTAQMTGVTDLAYDLMIVLTNKLEGVAAMQEYMQDADEAGDAKVRACFEKIAAHDQAGIDELRSLLAQHLGQGGGGS